MNGKERKTLEAVFTDPISGTIAWAAIERLLVAAGARVIEGAGSRVRFKCNGVVASFHRPARPRRPSAIRFAALATFWPR